MISTDPLKLCQLIAESERIRDERLKILELRERMALGAYDQDGRLERSPDNLAFAAYQKILPGAVTASPRIRITTSGGHLEVLHATALQTSVNQMMAHQRMEETLEPCLWNFMFKDYGCAFIERAQADMSDVTDDERENSLSRLEPNQKRDVGGEPGDEPSPRATESPRRLNPARWPRIAGMRPQDCGWDGKAACLADARFTWHVTRVDHEDLLKRARAHPEDWHVEAVEHLEAGSLRKDTSTVDRGEVCYYNMYVAGGVIEGERPGRGRPGVIYTVSAIMGSNGSISTGIALRRPFYWRGHPGGPHIFGGQYATGVDAHFVGILSAHEDALSMLDAVGMSVRHRIRNHKVVHAYDSASEDAVQSIRNADDGDYIPVPGHNQGNGAIMRIETGQVSPAEVAELREVQQNASRQLGIDDAARGTANPDATATAVSVAANSTQSLIGSFLDAWHRFVRECAERLVWELAWDEEISVRLNESGRETYLRAQLAPLMQQGLSKQDVDIIVAEQKRVEVTFQGGDLNDDKNGFQWESLELSIEPYSTEGIQGERAVARIMAWAQFLSFAGQQMVLQPHIRWVDIIKQMGKAYGVADAETVADVQIATELAQMQIAQGLEIGSVSAEVPDPQKQGATLREARGGARSPAGVDPGQFQMT